MANNIKLEKISISLGQRLNDGFTSAGVAIAGNTDGIVLTAAQRMDYINKAMFQLVNEVWIKANERDWKNAKQIFAGVFPELVVTRSVTTGAGGSATASAYAIITPNLDYFQLLEATVAGIQAEFMPSHLYLTVKSGRTLQVKGTSTIPMVVEIGGTIYFLPDDAAFQTKTAILTFLRQPLDKTTGNFLAMSDASTEDSPFLNSWNSKIAEISEQLFRIDAKE
jgi:hypothetical protein